MTVVQRERLTGAAIGFVGVALGAGLLWFLLGRVIQRTPPIDGDASDPIVVDNSELRIFRRDNDPIDLTSSKGYWSLDKAKSFEKLVGTVMYEDASSKKHFCHDIDIDIRDLTVEFSSGGTKAFEIKRDGDDGAVYASSSSPLQPTPQREEDKKNKAHKKKYTKLMRTDGKPANIDQVKYTKADGAIEYLCLGGGLPERQTSACTKNNSRPADVRLVIRLQ